MAQKPDQKPERQREERLQIMLDVAELDPQGRQPKGSRLTGARFGRNAENQPGAISPDKPE
jgi:hypothetical protein